jgi:predicted O-linked N-acetylglucosamine transferase (SPINDLY family)
MNDDSAKRIEHLLGAAAHSHRGGRLQDAERGYRQILALDPRHADALHLLGVVALQTGRHDEAADLIRQAVAQNASVPAFYNNWGNAERARGRLEAAAACYEKAYGLNPAAADVLYNLGVVLQELGRFEEAAHAYERVILANPDHAAALSNLGNVLNVTGRPDEALAAYERALKSRADFLPALVNRGNLLKARGRLAEAMESYRRALAINVRYPEAHNNLGLALLEAGHLDEAIASFKSAVSVQPRYLEAHRNLGNAFRERGEVKEAQASYQRALGLNSDDAEARLGLAMAAIPVFVNSSGESAGAADDFDRALTELGNWSRGSPLGLGRSVGSTQPFYLAYRPTDGTALLTRYGEMVCTAAAARWPAPTSARAGPSFGNRIRLAIVCRHVHSQHPVFEVLLKGMLAHLQRERLAVLLYHTGTVEDEDTAWARTRVDRFVPGPKSTTGWIDQIREDRPDIIFFPEVGMDPVTCVLAALRLAPLQVASWGHPITTGLSSIDLYVSGELLEPQGADAHYREKLVRLPGTGVCTQLTAISVEPWQAESSRGVVNFVLPHQPIKFDPPDDVLLTRIAKSVGECQFWLAEPKRLGWTAERLKLRLGAAFRAQGLDPDRYLRVTPWLPRERFLGFLDAMDVYLDCPAFSGYTTAWQALHRGVPLVTLEGKFLRMRLAAGLLRQIDVTEGIAQTQDQYVELATQFADEYRGIGRGTARREGIRRAASKADDNRAAIAALERVLVDAFTRNR